METEFLIVKSNRVVTTKFGKRRVINFTNGEATWINDTAAMWHINNNQKVEVVRDAKNKLTIVERSVGVKQEPLHASQKDAPRNQNGNGLQHVSEPLDRVVDDILDDQDLPVFTEADRTRIKRYIKSQCKMLKYCHETVIESFPEIAITDPRGARSLAVTLLISANQAISRASR